MLKKTPFKKKSKLSQKQSKIHHSKDLKSSRLKAGKKTIAWVELRKRLVAAFTACGIFSCEGRLVDNCTGRLYLGFAHRLKRNAIKDSIELEKVALLCSPCHEWLEFGDKQVMFDVITKIINDRSEDVNKYL